MPTATQAACGKQCQLFNVDQPGYGRNRQRRGELITHRNKCYQVPVKAAGGWGSHCTFMNDKKILKIFRTKMDKGNQTRFVSQTTA